MSRGRPAPSHAAAQTPPAQTLRGRAEQAGRGRAGQGRAGQVGLPAVSLLLTRLPPPNATHLLPLPLLPPLLLLPGWPFLPLTAQPLIQREALAAPVAGGPQAAQLLGGEPFILGLPGSHLFVKGIPPHLSPTPPRRR